MRIMRLYLKAVCELAGCHDEVQLVSLNDGAIDPALLQSCADKHLVRYEGCRHNKLRFVLSAFRSGLASDKIICGHIGQLPVAWFISKLRPGIPYYLVAHGIEVWRPFSTLERWSLKGTKKVFCVSDYTRRQLLQNCCLKPDQTCVLENVLDPSLDPISLPGRADSPPIILSISRLTLSDNYKGIDHLIAAMPAVRAAVPGVRLRIVGQGDGLPKLQSLARDLNLGGAVEFTGYLNDTEIAKELAHCRLFALPSQKEGFGLVYLEAMAHGRPCLGARAGGVPEVLTEETGVLVEYGDIPGIASAIIEALKRDWSVTALRERARAFSYPQFKDRLGKLLSQ
jgi:glycosyltransferase involved in cell wall biosynthesis